MRRTSKTIIESGPAVHTEVAMMGNNVLKNCRVLGFISRNKRIYPREIVAKSLNLYEGAPVNIDHPVREGPRKYEDRFGQITNVRIDEDGVYGDLTFNPAHPLADSFKWWAENQPNAIGLSHNAEAKTKFQKDGYEYITSIERVLSVDVVSDPGSTNGLFEHYYKSLESDMSKKEMCGYEDDNKDDEKKDEKKESSGMDFVEAESKVGQLKSKFMEVVNDEDKVMKLLSMLDTGDLTKEAEDDKKDDEDKKHESSHDDEMDDEDKKKESKDDDKDDEKKTEESLRTTNDPSVKKLLEELDTYRIKEHKEKLTTKAKDSCAKAGIPAYAITDTFVNTLLEADESNWKNILDDRRKVCLTTKTPISTGPVDSKASIKDLVKFLVQE